MMQKEKAARGGLLAFWSPYNQWSVVEAESKCVIRSGITESHIDDWIEFYEYKKATSGIQGSFDGLMSSRLTSLRLAGCPNIERKMV